MKLIIILTLFILSTTYTTAQELKYKIKSGDTNLGQLIATKVEKNGLLEIVVTSDVSVSLFIKLNINYKLSCKYKNNELVFSSVSTYVNGKLHSTSTTTKNNTNYNIVKDGHSSLYMNSIHYSDALLYFFEPKNESKMYSDFDNIDKSITKLKEHTYTIKNPENGHVNEYIYKNGLLESTTIHHKLLDFTVTRY
jgi:hypothetical protein